MNLYVSQAVDSQIEANTGTLKIKRWGGTFKLYMSFNKYKNITNVLFDRKCFKNVHCNSLYILELTSKKNLLFFKFCSDFEFLIFSLLFI